VHYQQVVVLDKEITIACGSGTQLVKWLGHVAIARYDEDTYECDFLNTPVFFSLVFMSDCYFQ
jgi:hypothetical protein